MALLQRETRVTFCNAGNVMIEFGTSAIAFKLKSNTFTLALSRKASKAAVGNASNPEFCEEQMPVFSQLEDLLYAL